MTHYDLLGIDPSATPAEIHAAYRTRARQAHPDTGHTATGDQMAAINEAWHVLGDPTRRVAYDTIISRHGTIADCAAKPRPASTPSEAHDDRGAVSGSSLWLLRRLLVTAMILAVAAMAAIVLIGFLQGP